MWGGAQVLCSRRSIADRCLCSWHIACDGILALVSSECSSTGSSFLAEMLALRRSGAAAWGGLFEQLCSCMLRFHFSFQLCCVQFDGCAAAAGQGRVWLSHCSSKV